MLAEAVALAPRVSGAQVIRAEKVGSCTVTLGLPEEVSISFCSPAKRGDAVAVRVLTDSPQYNHLELPNGRLARINPQDVVLGVLGPRRALKGFVGDVPQDLVPGDSLHILSLAGVMGRSTGRHHLLGPPIEGEFLGQVFQDGQPLNLAQAALPEAGPLPCSAPLVLVAGSCMNSGKTQAACELIKQMSRAGMRVAAGKLSGVAALRDPLNMLDHGAVRALTFLDCGHPSTVGLDDLAPLARSIVAELNAESPDAIVLELGDGILGLYEVESLFDDAELMQHCAALVYCAGDFVGSWGGIELLRRKGLTVDVISGSVTDSRMGVDYLKQKLGVAAANALRDGQILFELVQEKLQPWPRSR